MPRECSHNLQHNVGRSFIQLRRASEPDLNKGRIVSRLFVSDVSDGYLIGRHTRDRTTIYLSRHRRPNRPQSYRRDRTRSA